MAKSEILAELDELAARCLARDPKNRPQSVAAMIDVADRLAESHPWGQSEARDWWTHHRAVAS